MGCLLKFITLIPRIIIGWLLKRLFCCLSSIILVLIIITALVLYFYTR